jgi:selenium metabolism protein YedF
METIDCRGLSCPGPVIQTKKALENLKKGEVVAVEVDSEASRENVRRFAQTQGALVDVREAGDGVFRLVITASGKETGKTEAAPPVLLLADNLLGTGDDKLGSILMEGFISSLKEQEKVPDKILLMNAGVKLAVEGSASLEPLRAMIDRGSEIMVCGTCLDFFGLKEKLAVGMVSNMFDIQRTLLEASSVIRL